jgi:hypothetical protein
MSPSRAKMPCSSPPSIESRCSACHEVFVGRTVLDSPHETFWSCSAIKGYFISKEKQSLMCGLCGELFPEWSIFSSRKNHLNAVHKMASCDQTKRFQVPHQFRHHLVLSHHAIPGWWLDSLERNARYSLCGSCVLHGITSSILDSRLVSMSRSKSEAYHQDDTNAGGVEVVQQPSCNASRTNSMHRVHSDVSEYDAQGSLLKRTITDSYTSVADDAAPALQRPSSSSGSQAREAARGPTLLQSHLSCFRCRDSTAFASPVELTRHLCTVHSSDFVEARKYRRLENAYRKQRTGLRWALGLLSQDVAKRSNTEERDTRITDQITKALEELDLRWEDGDDGKTSLIDPDNR